MIFVNGYTEASFLNSPIGVSPIAQHGCGVGDCEANLAGAAGRDNQGKHDFEIGKSLRIAFVDGRYKILAAVSCCRRRKDSKRTTT